MPSWLAAMLSLVGVIAIVTGMILSHVALARYGAESAPKGPSFNRRHWRPVWKTRDWFTDVRGFRLYWGGAAMLSGGALAILLATVVAKDIF